MAGHESPTTTLHRRPKARASALPPTAPVQERLGSPIAMQANTTLDVEHACPRCYETLRLAEAGESRRRAVLLACPEPYCDYVLVLTEHEAFSARKWSWPDLLRFTRAAG